MLGGGGGCTLCLCQNAKHNVIAKELSGGLMQVLRKLLLFPHSTVTTLHEFTSLLDAYLVPCQTSKIKRFAKIVNV